jgi:hypothetical protein
MVSESRKEYNREYYKKNKDRMLANSRKRHKQIKEGTWVAGKAGRPRKEQAIQTCLDEGERDKAKTKNVN